MQVKIHFNTHEPDGYTLFVDEMKNLHFNEKVAIITNPKISGLHLQKLLQVVTAKELYIVTVPDGEEYKNIKTVDFILENLFNHRFNRSSVLIAFGGGVIGDMTGFVASVFQRGIDFIQIPTTLLSQVDASVGGKTGINNKYGKNLVGAFYQPKAVYIETSFLSTLPQREFSAGVAEMVKMALTFDRNFFDYLQDTDLGVKENLSYAIRKSVQIKAKVVSLDEKEKGLRAVLNYGHTFAHVIENLTDYKKFLHGEAVAIGIVMANVLARKLTLLSLEDEKKIKDLLVKYKLPVSYKIEDIELFYEGFFHDKKAQNSSLKFILLKGIGEHKVVSNIDKDLILEVLSEFSS